MKNEKKSLILPNAYNIKDKTSSIYIYVQIGSFYAFLKVTLLLLQKK